PPKPRTRPAPSERDQRIYFDYQTAGMRQTELAADYKLTQSRVSQIIRRVEAWVQGSKFKPSTGDDAASKTTSNLEPGTLNLAVLRRLEFERLNFTVREAMRHFRDKHK